MSWDAGAITGTLGLNINEYGEGMLQAEGIAQAFPAIVTEFLENPLLAVVSLAHEAAEAYVEMFTEVANGAANMSLLAEKGGVSITFLSELAAVGKTVNVGVEQISVAMKFLNRNMVDAIDGNETAQKSFLNLGITTDFLRDNLNNTEAVFNAVHAAISALPDEAERSRLSMEVMGRQGDALVPIFNLTREHLQDLIDTAHQFGAIDDDESGAAGRKWLEMSTEVGEAWEGMKKKLTEPILDYLTDHWDEIKPVLLDLSDTVGKAIPLSFELAVLGGQAFLSVIQALLTPLEALAAITDKLGITSGLDDSLHNLEGSIDKARGSLNQINIHALNIKVEPHELATEMAEKIKPHIDHSYERIKASAGSAAKKARVASSIFGDLGGGSGGGEF